MDVDRPGLGGADHIREQRQEGDVVEMRMRDEHMTDPVQRLEIEITDAAAGVDQDVVVDQDGRGSPARPNAAAGSQDANRQAHAGGPDRRLQVCRPTRPKGVGGEPVWTRVQGMAQS